MPEVPQPTETIKAQEAVENKESLSVSNQVEQGQKELMADVNHTIGRTMQISTNLEMNKAIRLKGMENLLKYVSARAVLETRGPEAFANKFSVRGKIGNIFKLKLEHEISSKFDPESVAKGETAKLYKTKAELTTTSGVILGLEKYQGKDKTKPYFGYKIKGNNLSIAFLGEYEMEGSETEINARIKTGYKMAKNMSLFADITLAGVDKPDQLGINNLKTYLGLNIDIKKDQIIAVAFDPKNQAGSISFVGRF